MSEDLGRSRRRRRIGCAVAAIFVCLASSIVSVVAVGAIVDDSVEEALAERGITCDPLSVDLALTLDRATLAPTTCRLSEGPIASATFPEGVTIHLDGTTPSSVEAPVVEVALGPRTSEPEAGVTSTVLAALGIGTVTCGLLSDAAWLSRRQYPDLTSGRVTVMRGAERVAGLEGLAVSSEEGRLHARVERMELAAASSARFSAVEAELTPSSAQAGTRVEVRLDLGFTEVGHELTVRATARGLDTSEPSCELSVD